MSVLRVTGLPVRSALVGPVNPLPPLDGLEEVHAVTFTSDDIPEEMARNVGYGRVDDVLPYLLQDGYSRDRADRETPVAILENDVLRATFLLAAGGRLWSLVHKPSDRELLYVNPVIQPVNFALRNAWFSGGVEWNIGTIGHAPLTFEPIHAARVTGPDGEPILRMFDWERMRETPFQIDAHLPDGSATLYLYVRVRNPNDQEVPIYWWSNVAVPEARDVRVVTPADAAYRFSYDGALTRVPIPVPATVDVTYATNGFTSNDYFFDVPKDRRPWIAAIDGEGRGLIQASTPLLRGRKLFIWGMAQPGRRWQEFLSEPGHPYLEIQAGIAQTQFEHVPLPAGESFEWVEAYGLLETDPAAVHGSWSEARASVEEALDRLVSPTALDRELALLSTLSDVAPVERLAMGSGWGALERRRRSAMDQPTVDTPGLPFTDDSLAPEQAPWLELLEHGTFPTSDPLLPPSSYVVAPTWRHLVEAAEGSWLGALHLGVIRLHEHDRPGARVAWARSLELEPNPWALRNLAVIDRQEGDLGSAAERLRAAMAMVPDIRQLASETIRVLLEARRPHEALKVIDGLGQRERSHGRVQVLETRAALDAGDLDRAWGLLDGGIEVPDLREGGVILEQLWYAYHELRLSAAEGIPVDDALRARVRVAHPVPRIYDFRKPE